jgi:hypothetical protein
MSNDRNHNYFEGGGPFLNSGSNGGMGMLDTLQEESGKQMYSSKNKRRALKTSKLQKVNKSINSRPLNQSTFPNINN